MLSLRGGIQNNQADAAISKIASSQLSLNFLEEVGIVMFSSELNIKEKHTSLSLLAKTGLLT